MNDDLISTEETVSDSRFSMWRALFALVHADGVTTKEETSFMHRTLLDNPFSDVQREILQKDMDKPESIDLMFMQITEAGDRTQFFDLARQLCWCDGDFDAQEQAIIERLNKIHIHSVDFDAMMREVSLELEQSKPSEPDVARKDALEKRKGFLSWLRG